MPYWGCGASGFLGPAGLMVFTMGNPVSGQACDLPQSTIITKPFPSLVGLLPDLRAGFPASGCRCVLRHALVLEAAPPSHRLLLLLHTGFLFSGPGWCGRLQPLPSMYSFGMWSPFGVNSVFLSLLIGNEDLHWWLFLFRYSHPFWGRVVFIRPPSVCRNFWWVVATLLPGLPLSFARGFLLLASSAAWL